MMSIAISAVYWCNDKPWPEYVTQLCLHFGLSSSRDEDNVRLKPTRIHIRSLALCMCRYHTE